MLNFKGVSMALIGGDMRDVELAKELIELGATLKLIGLPDYPGIPSQLRVGSLLEAVEGTDVIILPIQGTDNLGRVRASEVPLSLTQEVFKAMKGSILLIGSARKMVKDLCEEYGIKYIEYADLDEIAVPNSIPSAEGAIYMAMEATPITIHGSNSFVLGFGRTGKTLARMLCGIGAHVTLVARKPGDLARIEEMGYRAISFEELEKYLGEADFIFNTVPAMVLPGNVLKGVSQEVFILDLASPPGGVDFEAAKDMGIRAVLAPGLPGKVAPKTAGRILAIAIPKLIREELDCAARQQNLI